MKERWSSCADKGKLKKGPWTFEEDVRLLRSIRIYGEGRWSALAKAAGLQRCGKSCRLRWVNYLRPDLKRGNITPEEERMIIELHSRWGNRWSLIAEKMPGRTDNEIKNYWRCHLKKKLQPSEPAAATAKQEHSSQKGIVNSQSKVPQGHHPSVLEAENGGNMLSSSFTRQGNNNGFDVCSVEAPCRPQTGVEAHHHHHHLGNMQHLDSLQYPANLGSRVETLQQGMVMGSSSSSSSNSTHPVPGILCRLTSEIPLTEEIEIEIQQQHRGEGAGACEQRILNTCLDELYPIHNCDLDFDMGCETMNLMLWNNLLHDANNNPSLNTNSSIPSSFAPLQP